MPEISLFYDIVQVIPNEDYTVYVYFEDGKIASVDKGIHNKTTKYGLPTY